MNSNIVLARMTIGWIVGTGYGMYYSRNDSTQMKISASSLFGVAGMMGLMAPGIYPIIGIPYGIILAIQSL